MDYTLIITNQQYFYQVKKSWRRSISLKLLTSTTFLVSCNHLTPQFVIDDFIKKHTAWIIKHSPKVISYPDLLNLPFLSILDKRYQIIITHASVDKFNIDQINSTIDISTKHLSQHHLKHIIATHLKNHARQLITAKIINLQSLYHFQYGRLSLRNQRSRFGSCSSQCNLNFNWQIIFFLPNLFHHIICHELCHLTHHNHSPAFWNLLATYDPVWKSNHKLLKAEGNKYFLIKP